MRCHLKRLHNASMLPGNCTIIGCIAFIGLCGFAFGQPAINPDNTARALGDGRWDWTVFVQGAPSVLSRIQCVQYTLDPTFPSPDRIVCDRGTADRPFSLNAQSWGELDIPITISFRDGTTTRISYHLRLRGVAPQPTGTQTRVVKTNPRDGLAYVLMVPGNFRMGAIMGDDDARTDEKPPHPVRITKGFWLGETPVTVAAYKEFVKKRPPFMMPSPPSFNPDWGKLDHPILGVRRVEAVAYCGWAGGTLPTEAEWEYAARGGKDGLKYPWGNDITADNANFKGSRWNGTSPVRSYPPNDWGLYDMAGNVWEWLADWYKNDYYATQPLDKAADDSRGPGHSDMWVLRGGSYKSGTQFMRASARGASGPAEDVSLIGFRCSLEANR